MTDLSDKAGMACAAFPSRQVAEKAIDKLLEAGYNSANISVIMPQTDVAEETMAVEKRAEGRDSRTMGVGMGAGAVLGGAAGVLAGLGLLAIPGIGPLLAVGPIVAGITGALGGFGIGLVAGSLVDYGISRPEAQTLESRLRAGDVLVTLHCGTDCEKAMVMMQQSGATVAACSLPKRPA
jgi:hypothetical protein